MFNSDDEKNEGEGADDTQATETTEASGDGSTQVSRRPAVGAGDLGKVRRWYRLQSNALENVAA